MKKIGIIGWNTGEGSFGITKPYAEYFSKFGQVVILTPSEEIDSSLDLLVMPGGLDLAPQSSRMRPSFYTSNTDVMKQYFYDVTLDKYLDANIPIFAICLGFQQLSAKFGAKLIQNAPYFKSGLNRSELVDILKINPFYVNFVADAFLEAREDNYWYENYVDRNETLNLYKKHGLEKNHVNNSLQYYPANSIHHQGIEVEIQEGVAIVPDTNISVFAYNPAFLNLEAAFFTEIVAGVQYHPKSLGL